MTYKREILIKSITDNLAFSSKSITTQNIMSLFDSNRLAQEFFCGIFKIIFSYDNLKELDKLNDISNYPAIDLGDETKKIAFQITVDADSTKIKDTIKKFIKHKLYEKYERLVIFIIGKKKEYTTKFDCEGRFSFDKKEDIWDEQVLFQGINKLENNKLEELKAFLEEQLQEYKFPERLFDHDIKECIDIMQRDLSVLISFSPINNEKTDQFLIPIRNDDFITQKNNLNSMSWEFFKEKIRGRLFYNDQINNFLTNPINKSLKADYEKITSAIQNFYILNQKEYKTIENLFEDIFNKIKIQFKDLMKNSIKLEILLYSMYFNCDIGHNPKEYDQTI